MVTTPTRSIVTLRQTFSFYVPASKIGGIRIAADEADAVVVAGKSGPAAVQALRNEGWAAPVLFDRGAYGSNPGAVDASAWYAAQEQAKADRLLSPGRWVPWGSEHPSFEDQLAEELASAAADATVLLAIDHRWLTKSAGLDAMQHALGSLRQPVALVLADRTDPLSYPGAVNGLIALTTRIAEVSILRTDHGGIGALAFDAIHASIGLTPGHRHAVPPDTTGSAKPNDRSARVFVTDLMDWFTASTIAGWSTMRASPTCSYPCCDGRRIDRFFDARLAQQADLHNRTVLRILAEHVLDAPAEDRRRIFAGLCRAAIEHYGPMGNLTNAVSPKSQLTQWAQYA